MSNRVSTVSEQDFQREVLESPLPVLVDFGAEWCPPCRALEPVVEKLAEEYAGRVRVLKIDADEAPSIATRYRVRNLPTVISFVGGQEHKRHTGATSKEVLVRLLPEAHGEAAAPAAR